MIYHLSHFIRSSFPGESLVVVGIAVSADVDRLPVGVRRSPFGNVENIQFVWNNENNQIENVLFPKFQILSSL